MIKDTILQNNLRFHPVRNLSDLVETKIKKGFQKRFIVSCESNGVDPIEWVRNVEEACLFVLDGLGSDAKLCSLLNKAGNLHADGKYHEWGESATGALKIGDGSGFKAIPELKSGDYVVTDKRAKSSLGVRLLKHEVIRVTREYYIQNPPSNPSDGRGDSSDMTDVFWDGLTPVPQETNEEVDPSLPETTQIETSTSTFSIQATPLSSFNSTHTKTFFLENKLIRDVAPRDVLEEHFTLEELVDIHFSDRKS
jgi:hypothetical protein